MAIIGLEVELLDAGEERVDGVLRAVAADGRDAFGGDLDRFTGLGADGLGDGVEQAQVPPPVLLDRREPEVELASPSLGGPLRVQVREVGVDVVENQVADRQLLAVDACRIRWP